MTPITILGYFRHFALLFCAMAFTTGAVAQADISGVCGRILDGGIRDNYYLYTESELYDVYKSRLCDLKSENYDSFASSAGSLGINIPVAEGIVGLDAASRSNSGTFLAKYSAFCSSTYAQSDYKTRFQVTQSQASVSLANAWSSCTKQYFDSWQAANARGLLISVTPQDGWSELTVFIRRKSSRANSWKITGIAPASMQCSYKALPLLINKTVIAENDIQLNCSKNPNLQASISITSSDGLSNSVTVPAQASRVAELLQRNNEILEQLAQVSQRIEVTSTAAGAIRNSLQTLTRTPAASSIKANYDHNDTGLKLCPNGSVLIGFAADNRVIGAYAQGAIAGLNGICQPLIP